MIPKGPSSSKILRENEGIGGSYVGKDGSFALFGDWVVRLTHWGVFCGFITVAV